MKFLKQLWRGERGLAFTFWIMWAGGTIGLVLLMGASFVTGYHQPIELLFYSSLFLGIIYEPFIMISVWRSAKDTIERGGIDMTVGYLMRIVVLMGALYFLSVYWTWGEIFL